MTIPQDSDYFASITNTTSTDISLILSDGDASVTYPLQIMFTGKLIEEDELSTETDVIDDNHQNAINGTDSTPEGNINTNTD